MNLLKKFDPIITDLNDIVPSNESPKKSNN